MSLQYSRYFGEPSGPNIPDCIISEKPITALSGVRSSWLILARNSDLVSFASSARSFSSAYFSASSTICCACSSSFWRDWRRSAIVGVPEDEGLRDRLDGIAEADVGCLRALDQAHLLGDVDRDADQVRLAR